jgi:ubiquinone/menaquinone biosynthesis C-methylase UbiE
MKKLLKALVKGSRYFGSRYLIKKINMGVRALASLTHKAQHIIEWGAQPNPEWYDHWLDQYWSWKITGEGYPVERGVFSLLAVKPESRILELCCGDGFNAHHFYAARAASIYSMDFDPEAIRSAKSNFKNPKVKYVTGDIRKEIPDQKFDNVVWDAAIEHFTEDEIESIMATIKKVLTTDGVLSGYTMVEREDGHASHHEHEYEFHSKEDLARVLTKFFKKVRVFETKHVSRHNLYFYAADSAILPFESNWEKQVVCVQP